METKESRLHKIKIFLNKGYTCNIETGEVFNSWGKPCTTLNKGYVQLHTTHNGKRVKLLSHHLVYYVATRQIVDCIDHVNQIRNDNRITNLREVTTQQNQFNTKAKGYYWNKRDKKWKAHITLNGEKIHLGYHSSEQDASNAYKEAKIKYHTL